MNINAYKYTLYSQKYVHLTIMLEAPNCHNLKPTEDICDELECRLLPAYHQCLNSLILLWLIGQIPTTKAFPLD